MSSTSDSSSDFGDGDFIIPSIGDRVESVINHEQWVNTIEFCSIKAKSKDSVAKGIGVEKLCRTMDSDFDENSSNDNCWTFPNNYQNECLVVSFETKVFVNEIHIYECLNFGSVVKLEILEIQTNQWLTMWERKSIRKSQANTNNIFKPLLRRYRIQTDTIRITFDPKFADRIGIQAIKLIGSNYFNEKLNYKSLSQSMIKLYEQTLNRINIDVEFIIDDRIICAHRNILCYRSTYFRSLLLSDFNEKYQTTPFKLTDIDYDTFLEILYFIYTGTYNHTMTYDVAISTMIYANKINLLSAKNASIEHICLHLNANHDQIISVYLLVKKFSPQFDLLLDYVYDMCSKHLSEICNRKDFAELDKELIVDLICEATKRSDLREERLKQAKLINGAANNNEEEEEEEEEEE